MCIPQAAIGAASLAVSAVGTAASIGMGFMSAHQQAAQAQQQVDLQHRQRVEQAQLANKQAVLQQQGQVKAEQASRKSYYQQFDNITNAVNKTYVQEQAKQDEARVKAAFKTQSILAQSIGAQGKILASGATGNSVGLLSLDADRQAGFAKAQTIASVDSADIQSAISQDIAYDQAQSSANQAFSRTSAPTQAPVLDPYGMAGLNIPT